jgi:hypothetical protein
MSLVSNILNEVEMVRFNNDYFDQDAAFGGSDVALVPETIKVDHQLGENYSGGPICWCWYHMRSHHPNDLINL